MSRFITSRPFGSLASGERVDAYTLTNASGASLQVLTYGGIVTSLRIHDRRGDLADVVLGFNALSDYVAGHPYFGAIIGRIAGRIAGGRLSVEGRNYSLACNGGQNHLHGGNTGLDKRVWSARPLSRSDGAASLQLSYRSPDGEEGYPGNIAIAITYTLTAENAFIIESEAIADRVTPLNLTHHSYFNLAGEGSGSVADHEVEIHSHACVPVTDAMVPSGCRESVAGRTTDFTRPRRLGDAWPQLFKAHGDLYLLREKPQEQPTTPTFAARVIEPHSGRVMEVSTDETCLQFYTGMSLDGTLIGKAGRPYGPHAGLCLECLGYPDSAGLGTFGSILLHPDSTRRHRSVYAFSTV